MSNQIKVYAEKGHAEEKDWLRHLIYPIRAYWGDGTPDWSQWQKGFEFYKVLFTLTDRIDESDVVFLPMTLNYYAKKKNMGLVNDLAERAKNCHKTTFVWIDGDHRARYDHPDCIFLKYFSYQSELNSNEFILPGDLKQDLVYAYLDGKLQIKEKEEKPSVGFDGIATYPHLKLAMTISRNILRKLKNEILRYPFEGDTVIPFLLKRKRLLEQLQRIDNITANFTIRNSFALGTIGGQEIARLEFINNILKNDYTFCYRGAANYSLRFYETLCLGRIPLFINTDCKLPFEDRVNWQEVCIWVEENELPRMSEIILDVHHSMTPNQFIEKQIYCRELWLKYFSKEGFYNQFHSHLKDNYLNSETGAST